MFGGLGTGVGLLCCFTGLLPLVLTSIGASGLISTLYRDVVLFPFAGVSFVVMIVGLWLMKRNRS